jgi:sulfite reductase (NADPH) flavoprotein alpha-component
MSLNISVLFGTETGNAEECAQQLGRALESAGFTSRVFDMDDYDPPDLARETMTVFVSSTYGNGDPPFAAEAMMGWLKKPDASVSGVSFAVCGLGDSTYPMYNQAGRDFDRLLEERGGRRVIPRQDCDVDYDEPFDEFTQALVLWLGEHGAALGSGDTSTVTVAAGAGKASADSRVGTRSNPVTAKLVRRRRLNREGSSKETVHYEFSWPDVDVVFEPGDSFAVLPQNNPAEVEAVLAAVGLGADVMVNVGDRRQPLRNALLAARDLHTVSNDMLNLISGASQRGAGLLSRAWSAWRGKPKEEATVVDISSPETYLADRHVLDVLQDFPEARVTAQAFVDSLKRLRPRLYSVASSPLLHPEGVHFTVETLRYTQRERACEGVATTWLADRLEDGAEIPMYCVPAAHFRLPETAGVPVIMIGPGTGVAPFIAFLQQRKAQGDDGKNWLFFGHQHEATDFLYEDELKGYQADGTLNELTLAWSRDQDSKVYVQHRLKEQGEAVWSWLASGAHIYVCGDKNAMAPQVRETLVDICVTHGGLSAPAAAATVDGWESSGRYCVDAY